MKNLFKKLPLSVLVWYVLIRRLFGEIYIKQTVKVYIFNKNTTLKKIEPGIECEIKEIRYFDELKKYKKNISPINFAKFSIFLKHGCVGYFAVKGDDLLSTSWIADSKKYTPQPHLKCVLEDYNNEMYQHIFYSFFSHTYEKYRRKNLFSYILFYIMDKNQNENTCIIGDVDITNIGSQKGVEKVGFKFEYILNYLRLFGITLHISKDFKKN